MKKIQATKEFKPNNEADRDRTVAYKEAIMEPPMEEYRQTKKMQMMQELDQQNNVGAHGIKIKLEFGTPSNADDANIMLKYLF